MIQAMKFKVEMKELFFDRDRVLAALDKARRKVLAKQGLIVMRSARKSLVDAPGRKWSAPGRPPYSRTGLLKRNIFFAYDPSREDVIVGPALLAGVRRGAGGEPVPAVLEHGGTTLRRDGRPLAVDAHPFMRPALERHKGDLAPMWRDSVKG